VIYILNNVELDNQKVGSHWLP